LLGFSVPIFSDFFSRIKTHIASGCQASRLDFLYASSTACIGPLLAAMTVYAAISISGTTVDFSHPHILSSQYTAPLATVRWQERFEVMYFSLAVPLAVAACIVAARFGRRAAWACILSLALFVAALTMACDAIFRGITPNAIVILACIGAIALPFLVSSSGSGVESADRKQPDARFPSWAVFIPYILIVMTGVAPASFSSIATTLTDPHIGSWLFAPAINSLSTSSVTAVDFESHYGLGHALLFSKFLGNSFEQTTHRAAYYLWALCVIFYASVFWTTAAIYRSSVLAGIVSLFIFASGFDGFSFSIPSNMPIRYVLAPACLLLCLYAPMSAHPKGMSALAGIAVACAIFWQTDTGLQIALASGLYFLILTLLRRSEPINIVCFAGVAIAGFSLMLLALVGPTHVLTAAARLTEPISLYSGGFGGLLMIWSPGWSYWYNILTPIILGASIVVAMGAVAHEGQTFETRMQDRALLIFSIFGYFTLMKWVNRSVDVLWWLNGWPVLLVLGIWWVKATSNLSRNSRLAWGAGTLVAIICVLHMSFGQNIILGLSRAPATRWLKYFDEHPGRLSDLVHAASGSVRDPNSRRHARVVSVEATEILKRSTQPGERVAVLSGTDWHYHVDAVRPSALHWLPLHLTHSNILLERNALDIQRSQRLFIEDGYWDVLRKWNTPTYERVQKLVSDCFVPQETAAPWTIMQNKCKT
jgi:hypothetical protein